MKLTVLLCSALLLSFCGLSLQKNKCGDHDDCPEPKKPALEGSLEDIRLPDDDDLYNVPHCKDRDGIHFCTRAYEPVCGSDGVTYFSRCDLCRSNRFKLRRVEVIHSGEC
ncbi:serine protease inhibitor Kazal-type 4-like isoform X1 [Sebastes umbrosus]|uniref:serine protease inhibitor Kazal-type 4-like isoform X1 n=1 Tax=Sebastes umbrosus TaxID=72105 RepID=UPI00189CB37C|nr:serine protease inhibitor Kazal-type 4-like isoform X1 [Sebastes umbrosus]